MSKSFPHKDRIRRLETRNGRVSKNHRYSSHLQVIECPNKRLFNDSVGEFDFRGTFYFSRALKMADIPHREEKNALFGVSFPTL